MPHHNDSWFSFVGGSHASSEGLTIRMPYEGPNLQVETGGTTVEIESDGSMIVRLPGGDELLRLEYNGDRDSYDVITDFPVMSN
jgi:hypothetical protein